ncbi:MAG TPA: SprT-like domain-containing protein [Tepidisphaeraceae bacterium]|jgi:predicted SprT family Zn-dependent metalloprotease
MHLAKAKALATRLMAKHLASDWTFGWMRALSRLGQCRYREKQIRLSRQITRVSPLAEVHDTVLHEIAHALTPGARHGPAWKAACMKLGCSPKSRKEISQHQHLKHNIYAICDCGNRMGAQRINPMRHYRCGRCGAPIAKFVCAGRAFRFEHEMYGRRYPQARVFRVYESGRRTLHGRFRLNGKNWVRKSKRRGRRGHSETTCVGKTVPKEIAPDVKLPDAAAGFLSFAWPCRAATRKTFG